MWTLHPVCNPLAPARGLQTGAKTGSSIGLNRGMFNDSMTKANTIAINDREERQKRMEDWKNDKWAFFDGVSQGRLGDFVSNIKGQSVGVDDSLRYQAGQRFQTASNGIIQTFDKAGSAAKTDAVVRKRNASDKIVEQVDANGNKTGVWTTKFGHTDLQANSEAELLDKIQKAYDDEIRTAEVNKMRKEIETLGTDGFTKMAASVRKLYSQDFDSLGEGLQKSLQDAAYKSMYTEDANGNEVLKYSNFADKLKTANNGRAVDFHDAESISRIVEGKEFQNLYKQVALDAAKPGASAAQIALKKEIDEGIASYYRDIARAGETVSQHISNEKGFSAGTEINRFTGRSVNNLGNKPDKK